MAKMLGRIRKLNECWCVDCRKYYKPAYNKRSHKLQERREWKRDAGI